MKVCDIADLFFFKLCARIEKQDLIIIDDFGMQPLDDMTMVMLLEIIEDRHQKSSTVIASHLPVDKWYDVIGDKHVSSKILRKCIKN